MKKRMIEFLMTHAGTVYRKRQLARILGVSRSQYRDFRSGLNELMQEGQIFRVHGGGYVWIDPSKRRRGKLELHRKGFGFLQVKQGEDIFVHSTNLMGAINGDTVEVALFPSPIGRGTEGRVTRILERGTQKFIGTVSERDEKFYLHIDPATPRRGIQIMEGSEVSFSSRDVVVAKVEDWGDRRRPIRVKVERVIGNIGNAQDDMKIVCHKFDLDPEFPARVLAESKNAKADQIQKDLANRKDFRKKRCITIDPADARDFDDALSLEKDNQGRWMVGVHIADVSFFVSPGSELDREARRRGTSVYFAEGTVHMLPENLSAGLCSLVPGQDRLAISAMMTLDKDCKVVETSIVPSVIRNSSRFTYSEVQAILDGKKVSPYSDLLKEMRDIGRVLQNERQRQGSIDFDIPEPIFRFQDSSIPHEIHPSERLDSHRVVEEFMLLANRVVAETVPATQSVLRSTTKDEPVLRSTTKDESGNSILPFIYRIHPEPPAEDVEAFMDILSRFKLVKGIPSKPGVGDFRRVLAGLEDSPYRSLIQTLALRAMTKAVYSVENLGHYGLAFDSYCHFTSPIRRYPDLMVHRMIKEYLFGSPDKVRPQKRDTLKSIARQSTDAEIRAMDAERDYIKLKQLRWLSQHLDEQFEGIISGVVSSGMFVELEDALVEGYVSVDSMDDDYYTYDERSLALVGTKRKESFRLGRPVRVKIHDVVLESRQANFRLVELVLRSTTKDE